MDQLQIEDIAEILKKKIGISIDKKKIEIEEQ